MEKLTRLYNSFERDFLMYFDDDDIERIFKKMARSFLDIDEIFGEVELSEDKPKDGSYYYGYTITIGPDGKPKIKEFGNIKPKHSRISSKKEPLVDKILDKKRKITKLVADMPGIQKDDIMVNVKENTVNIDAQRGVRKYHAEVPLEYEVDEDSFSTTYSNGIFELSFKIKDAKKPKTS